ncbi:50S ribosomal protein L31 [Candidatus Microgenomates bacterium]|nr:MAG: 50S ribosomal protein L31 [Candidatus Microgenomates bacterium]
MKVKIHPQWYPEALVTCACGNAFKVGSTREEFRVEICSRCHPFFTGEMRFVDAKGKLERFAEQQEKAQKMAPTLAARKAKKAGKVTEDSGPKTLKEMLMGA